MLSDSFFEDLEKVDEAVATKSKPHYAHVITPKRCRFPSLGENTSVETIGNRRYRVKTRSNLKVLITKGAE